MNATIELIVRDALWVIIIAGWCFLLVTGLEADKPLSGGLPGNVDLAADRNAPPEGLFGRIGVAGAWLTFGLIALSLPVVLWWILAVHG